MKLRFWFLLPTRVVLALLLAVPLAIVCVYSGLTRGAYGGVTQPWTLENYARFFDPLYGAILLRSLLMAGAATALCLLLGFPLALFISRAQKWRGLFFFLVVLPLLDSFLVGTYPWMFLLCDPGLLHTLLESPGVVQGTPPLLFYHR